MKTVKLEIYDVLQINCNNEGWRDYCTLREENEFSLARRAVAGTYNPLWQTGRVGKWRVIRGGCEEVILK